MLIIHTLLNVRIIFFNMKFRLYSVVQEAQDDRTTPV